MLIHKKGKTQICYKNKHWSNKSDSGEEKERSGIGASKDWLDLHWKGDRGGEE